MNCVIFSGPSLPPDRTGRWPGVIRRPPVKQGDLISAWYDHRPRAVGIIDGADENHQSVRHKEIVWLLDRGVAVYGAAAIGALRAVETAAFGMRGLGWVYERYLSREVDDDAEILARVGPAGEGYPRLSEPLVNLRATFEMALERGLINRTDLTVLIKAARSIHYRERTLAAVLEQARGITEANRAGLAEFVKTDYLDIQRRDAELLLKTMTRDLASGRLPEAGPGPGKEAAEPEDPVLKVLKYRDREIGQAGRRAALFEVLDFVAAGHPRVEALNCRALDRGLVLFLADHLRVEVSARETARWERRFRARRGLEDENSLTAWLKDNDLDRVDFQDLAAEEVRIDKLRAWFMERSGSLRNSDNFLNTLKLEGDYPDWVRRALGQIVIDKI